MAAEEAVDAAEIARILDCSTDKVRRLARTGGIPAFRLGENGHWRFFPSAVRDHLTPSTDTWARSPRSLRGRRAA